MNFLYIYNFFHNFFSFFWTEGDMIWKKGGGGDFEKCKTVINFVYTISYVTKGKL